MVFRASAGWVFESPMLMVASSQPDFNNVVEYGVDNRIDENIAVSYEYHQLAGCAVVS